MPNQSPTWTNLPWTIRLFSSVIHLGFRSSCRSNGSINRRLINLFEFQAPTPSTEPINGIKTFDVHIDPSRNIWFRFYIPCHKGGNNKHGGNMPLIIYFHGGGFAWMASNALGFDNLCRRFAKELTSVVISMNYRLAPEQRGNLEHHVAVKACEYEFQNLKVIGVIAIQPFFRGEERTESEKLGKEAYLIEYPIAFHAFYAIPMVPESGLCIKEIRDFMEKQCAK
ncbi:hypothetical protein Patl1_07261 [Pistacia atlantica]|uniref:Uncharacterized protein n=1 Tax=Pistacia atlantica TaxID=434234 RepID=A0ACC1AK09_9ROSI|nr:hypothetical protein Patl1_07261 [Pistacia atlantica]